MKQKMMLLKMIATLLFAVSAPVFADLPVTSTVTVVDMGDYHKVSFECDPEKVYALYGSETGDDRSTWFHIKSVIPGENHSTVTTNGDVSVVTTTAPKPFLHWSTSEGPGFVKVVETQAAAEVHPSAYVEVTAFRHLGDRAEVTFKSDPWQEYVIWASRDLKEWIQSDTLEDGERIQSFEVWSGHGETTTVELPIPFLPWFDKSKGFLKVSRKGSPFSFGRALQLIAAPEKTWALCCTYDPRQHIPMLANDGNLGLALVATGPKLKDYSKYMYITAWSKASRSNPTPWQNDFEVIIPSDNPETEKVETLIQVIRLSHYEGSETPTIIYDPNPVPPVNVRDSILHSHLTIDSGVVVAATVFKPEQVLENNVELEQNGVTFKVKLPTADAAVSITMAWAVAAMDKPTYIDFCATLDAAQKE